MSRKKRSNNSNTEKSIVENKLGSDVYTNIEPAANSIDEDGYSEYEDFTRVKKHGCKYSCEELCDKYLDCDCNFACASDRELLITILCVLKNEKYGLKAIEHKLKKSELDGDLKNIKSITDLLERAIVGLGETAVGAVKKAVDAAGTMTDITSGLAKIAAGAAGTAGSVAFTTQGLANVAAGTAGTAGATALTVSGLSNTAAGTAGAAAAGAATAGAAADVAAETAGLAAASAATVGAVGDIAAETAGLTAAGAATVGAAADIASESAGAAAGTAATVGAAANIASEAAGAASAGAVIAGAGADIAAEGAGIAAATAGTVGAAADIASESAGAVAGTAAIAGVASEIVSEAAGATASAAAAFSTGTIIPEKDKDTTIQVWFLNNNTEPSRAIEFTMYNTKDTPKSTYYSAELVVSARSSAFFTVTPIPDSYEIRIQGLDKNIFAYAVVLDKAEAGLNPVKPIEGKILFINS